MPILTSKLPLNSVETNATDFLSSALFRPRRETPPGGIQVYVRWAGGTCDVRYGGTRARLIVVQIERHIKGEDQHIASLLKQAGDSEGVLVLMGWLNARVLGGTSTESWDVYDGVGDSPEYGLDTGTRETPIMSHVYKAKMWADDVKDMQGREVGIAKIQLDEDNILPFRAFSGVSPGGSNVIDEYWGNVRSIDSIPFAHETHICIGRCIRRV
jgi:hypothetical protein